MVIGFCQDGLTEPETHEPRNKRQQRIVIRIKCLFKKSISV